MFLCQVFFFQAMIQNLDKKSDWNFMVGKVEHQGYVAPKMSTTSVKCFIEFVYQHNFSDLSWIWDMLIVFNCAGYSGHSAIERKVLARGGPQQKKSEKIKHFKWNTVLTNWFLRNIGDNKKYVYKYLLIVPLQVQTINVRSKPFLSESVFTSVLCWQAHFTSTEL